MYVSNSLFTGCQCMFMTYLVVLMLALSQTTRFVISISQKEKRKTDNTNISSYIIFICHYALPGCLSETRPVPRPVSDKQPGKSLSVMML